MIKLNQDTYKLLSKAGHDANHIVKLEGSDNWYELSYKLFADAPINSIDDFWKIVACAYSWMPTIPTINSYLIKEPDELLVQLQSLKKGDVYNLSTLVEQLIPVINNSFTGTSKVLHFINPKAIPIIDSNVLRGYDIFFFRLYPQFDVPKLPAFKTALNKKHIAKYLSYVEVLKQWVTNCDGKVSLRDIELALFELGKNSANEEPSHPIYNS